MKIRVECHRGHRADESPLAIWVKDRRIGVEEILDRWPAPEHRYFKVRGDDQGVYIIRNDVVSLEWEMVFYQDPQMKPYPVRGERGGKA